MEACRTGPSSGRRFSPAAGPTRPRCAAVADHGARPAPDFVFCTLAAALINDRDLWRRIILRHAQRDYVYYMFQKDSGTPKSELGSFPSFENSKGNLGRWAEGELKSANRALAEEIWGRYQVWLGEVLE